MVVPPVLISLTLRISSGHLNKIYATGSERQILRSYPSTIDKYDLDIQYLFTVYLYILGVASSNPDKV